MGVSITALFPNRAMTVLQVAELISKAYGGSQFKINCYDFSDHYTLSFRANPTQAELDACEGNPLKRLNAGRQRRMSVFTNGNCSCDYVEATGGNTDYVMLSLDCNDNAREIFLALFGKNFNGWIKDEGLNDEWTRVTEYEKLIAAGNAAVA